LKGDFVLEQYAKLSSYIGEVRLPDALNEVFITSHVPAKLLHTRIWRDNVAVAECQSDGIVVASQVGSTGYSLSGGGPVLDPKIDAFVLTPICPLTTFHPIVFSAKSTVSIELLKPKKAVVVVDGHYQMQMGISEKRLMVRKSEYKASFVRFDGDFYRRLKGRLLFPRGERL
jgi:NAD+ kinase